MPMPVQATRGLMAELYMVEGVAQQQAVRLLEGVAQQRAARLFVLVEVEQLLAVPVKDSKWPPGD